MTNSNRQPIKDIEQSIEKFKTARKNLGANANEQDKKFLQEMISKGKHMAALLKQAPAVEKPPHPFSISIKRVANTLKLFFIVLIVVFAIHFAIDALKRIG